MGVQHTNGSLLSFRPIRICLNLLSIINIIANKGEKRTRILERGYRGGFDKYCGGLNCPDPQ